MVAIVQEMVSGAFATPTHPLYIMSLLLTAHIGTPHPDDPRTSYRLEDDAC